MKAVKSGVNVAPKRKRPTTQDSSSDVIGYGRGLFAGSTSPLSFGIIGDVKPAAIPALNAAKLPVIQSEF